MCKQTKRVATMMILSLTLVAGALGLRTAFSGQLDTPLPPAPTMYTLEEMYNFRVWKMSGKTFLNHPGNTRFAVHDPGTPGDTSDDLVLDKDTGLIWARDADIIGGLLDAYNAIMQCRGLPLGERMGWRLPSVEELASLIDLSVGGSPKLPAGYPFANVQAGYYWTDLTMGGALQGYCYGLRMTDGDITELDPMVDTAYVWAVWGAKSGGF